MPLFEVQIKREYRITEYVEAEDRDALNKALDDHESWYEGFSEIDADDFSTDTDVDVYAISDESVHKRPEKYQAAYGALNGKMVAIGEYRKALPTGEIPAFFEDKHTIPMPL